MIAYRAWLRRGKLDLEDALILLTVRRNRYVKEGTDILKPSIQFNNIYVLSQQAIEKSLKACLLIRKYPMYKDHNIVDYLRILSNHDIKFKSFIAELKPLYQSYSAYKYVKEDGTESKILLKDAESFYSLASSIFNFARDFIKSNESVTQREVAIDKMNIFGDDKNGK